MKPSSSSSIGENTSTLLPQSTNLSAKKNPQQSSRNPCVRCFLVIRLPFLVLVALVLGVAGLIGGYRWTTNSMRGQDKVIGSLYDMNQARRRDLAIKNLGRSSFRRMDQGRVDTSSPYSGPAPISADVAAGFEAYYETLGDEPPPEMKELPKRVRIATSVCISSFFVLLRRC